MSVFDEAPRSPDESEAEDTKIVEDQIDDDGQQADVIELDDYRDHRHRDVAEERLVARAQQNDQMAFDDIVGKYKSMIRIIANNYFIAGAGREDVVQEAMVGLYKAVKDFDPRKGSNFNSFARLCMTRQVITAVKTATRFKHAPLNTYVSFSHSEGFNEGASDDVNLGDALAGLVLNLDEVIVGQEGLRLLVDVLKNELSPLEYDVLKLFFEGEPYREIAEHLQIGEKVIDNALQRVKRKVAIAQERSETSLDTADHSAAMTLIDQERAERQASALAALRRFVVAARPPETDTEQSPQPTTESLADVNQEFYITYSALENMRRHGIKIAEPVLESVLEPNEYSSTAITEPETTPDITGARSPGKFIIASTAPKGPDLLLKHVKEAQNYSDPDGVIRLEKDYPIPPLSENMARSMFMETLEWGPELPSGAYILPQSEEALGDLF